jgi:hypothetical protein
MLERKGEGRKQIGYGDKRRRKKDALAYYPTSSQTLAINPKVAGRREVST